MTYRQILLSLLMAVVWLPSMADSIDTSTHIADPAFRTLKISNPDNFFSLPVIRLNTNDRITVSFDELGEDYSFLQYRLIHCNVDWQPSRLLESEYLDGFNIADVEDYAFSSNTFVHFVNYRIEIPNDRMSPMVSGNYLLQVFDQNDPDRILLQARFQVSENAVMLDGNANARTDKGFRTEWQQATLMLHTSGFKFQNPYQDILVKISQNNREATLRHISRPTRVDGETIVYEHMPELIFPASNEYRRFETVRITGPGMHVDSTRFGDVNYHAWLTTDMDRAYRSYEYDQTQRGRFMIRDYNSTDSDLGADYVTVHFSLDAPRLMNADVYVDGEFTHGRRDETTRMVYDEEKHVYTLEIPLKQGSYNYQYVAVAKGSADEVYPPDTAPIEGNKYETLNEYDAEVWYRPPGARADRLLTVSQILATP